MVSITWRLSCTRPPQTVVHIHPPPCHTLSEAASPQPDTHPQPGRWWRCRTGPAAWWRSVPGCPVPGWEPAPARGSPEPGGVCRSDAPRRAEQKLQFYLEGRAAGKQNEKSFCPSQVQVFTCTQKTYISTQREMKQLIFHKTFILVLNHMVRASLVAQWLRIHLPMQGTQVWALVREDPTCRGATKPVRHNYWACTLEPASHNYWAHMPQLLKPSWLEPVLCNKRSHRSEKPVRRNKE